MRALVIANEGDDGPGFVGQRLEHHGYTFTRCWREDTGDWPDLAGHDLVLLLGSEWSVYWPHVAASIQAESDLVAAAHTAGTPVLGICFGSQLVAHALGGSVHAAATPEIGWHEIDTDLPDAIARGPWMQWHDDAVTLPPGARELARSAVCPQAFQLGRTFAVQFHPEVTTDVVARWAKSGSDQLRSLGTSADELIARSEVAVVASKPNADRLVDWFVSTVAT